MSKVREEIDYLLNYATVQYIFEVRDGEPLYTNNDVTEDGIYSCPICLTKLFDSEKDAVEFLRGDKNGSN